MLGLGGRSGGDLGADDGETGLGLEAVGDSKLVCFGAVGGAT